MKRPGLVTTVMVIQCLVALVLAGTAVYLLWLTRTPDIAKDPDAVHGLKIAAAILSGPTVVLFLVVYGLWKGKLWGWWLALVTDVLMLVSLAYGLLDENSVDMDQLVVTLCFLIFPIFLLLPKVRKFYWSGAVSQ